MTTGTVRHTVVGVFHTTDRAKDAIDALKDAAFRPEDIGVLTPDRGEARDVASETGTQAPEGAATGALAGGILGGMAGWLVGIGAVAIPGVGPFIAGGALAATLGGAAIGAGVGAVAGALIGMGIPEEEAHYYEGEVKGGRTLVTVRADGRYDEARAILRRNGAYDIQDRGTAGTVTGRAASMTDTGLHRTDPDRGAIPMPPAAGRSALDRSELTGTGQYEGVGVERSSEVRVGHHGASVPHWDEVSDRFRADWESRPHAPDQRWETVEPYRRFAYEMANDRRYRDRDWTEVEPHFRDDYRDWAHRHDYSYDESAWDRMKDEVRDAWNSAQARVQSR